MWLCYSKETFVMTPRWSSYRLKDIKPVVVEEWLR